MPTAAPYFAAIVAADDAANAIPLILKIAGAFGSSGPLYVNAVIIAVFRARGNPTLHKFALVQA